MKKNIFLLTAVLYCTMMNLNAVTPIDINGVYYILNENEKTATVTNHTGGGSAGGNSYGTRPFSMTIPANVKYNSVTYTVTSIGYFAFYDCSFLTSITLPSSITKIASYAFNNCKNLTSITFHDSVSSIGEYAFEDCSQLSSIIIPEGISGLTSIGSHAFKNCKLLSSIASPNNITSIGEYAFYNCNNLSSFTPANGITKIGNYAFCNCSNLSSVSISDNLTGINDYAFYNCKSLTNVSTPAGLTNVGKYAFYGCQSLRSFVIPNGITVIQEGTFEECHELNFDSVVFSNKLTTIEKYAFRRTGYHSSNTVNIPNSVTTIGTAAFMYSAIRSIKIPSRLTAINDSTFYSATLDSIVIPNSIISIGKDAFTYCTELKYIKCESTTPPYTDINSFDLLNGGDIVRIPVYVPLESLYSYRMSNYWRFLNIAAIGSQPHYISTWGQMSISAPENGSTDSTGINLLLTYQTSDPAKSFTLEDAYWEHMETDTLPHYIYAGAYSIKLGANALYLKVYKPIGNFVKGDTLKVLGYNCLKVSSNVARNGDIIASMPTGTGKKDYKTGFVVLRNNIDTIYLSRAEATGTCVAGIAVVPSIADVFTVKFIDWNGTILKTEIVLSGESATAPTIPSRNGYTFTGWDKEFNNITNNMVVNAQYEAEHTNPDDPECSFIDSGKCGDFLTWELSCDSTTLTISGTGEMNDYTSNLPWSPYKNSILKIIIQEGVTSIGKYAFYYCSSLTSISIGSSVASIGQYAFHNCTNLTSAFIQAETPPLLGSWAFEGDNLLTSMYVPCGTIEAYKTTSGWSSYSSIIKQQPLPYTISTNAQHGNISIDSICSDITLTAIPNEGYYFTQWSDGNKDNPRSFVLTQDTTFTAEFSNQYSINITCNEEYGTIIGENGMFDYLSEHTYEAVPNSGYYFVKWSDGNKDNPRTIILTQDTSLTAEFSKQYSILVSCNEEQGSINGENGMFDYLSEHTYEAVPNSGYYFVKWSDGNKDNPRTLVLTQDTSLTAIFDILYNVSVLSDDPTMGSASFSDLLETQSLNYGQYPIGTNLIAKAIPNQGYKFSHWSDGLSANPRGITVESDINLRAFFESETPAEETYYTISVSSNNTSMGTVSGGGTYEEGATATVTASPKNGYKFTKWSNGSTANPYSFTVTSNMSLTAYFEQSSTPEPENSKIWNMSDAAFNSLGTITSTTTVDELTIYATSSSNVVIDKSSQEIDGLTFTHRIKLSGTGTSNARMLSFTVDGECDIDIYLKSASGSVDRKLNVDKGSFGSTLQQIPASSSAISKGTVHYPGNATTIYLYSPSSGVNIYAIRVTYNDDSVTTENTYLVQKERAQKILLNGQILILRGDKTYTLQGQEVK